MGYHGGVAYINNAFHGENHLHCKYLSEMFFMIRGMGRLLVHGLFSLLETTTIESEHRVIRLSAIRDYPEARSG